MINKEIVQPKATTTFFVCRYFPDFFFCHYNLPSEQQNKKKEKKTRRKLKTFWVREKHGTSHKNVIMEGTHSPCLSFSFSILSTFSALSLTFPKKSEIGKNRK